MDMFQNWSEVKEALLEGLDSSKKTIVGQLLENEKQHILQETAAAGSVAAHDVAGFRKIMIPMIRRIIPGTIATELVGVQAMQGPVSLVYTMRYKYGESVTQPAGPFNPTTGNITANDELFGNNPVLKQFYSGVAGDGTPVTGQAQVAGAGGIGPGGSAIDAIAGTQGGAWPSSLPAYDTSLFGPYGPNTPGIPGQQYAGRLYGVLVS